jgi:hypothetical protein
MLFGILSVIIVLLLDINELPFDVDVPFELVLFPPELLPCANIGATTIPANKDTDATIATIAIKFKLYMLLNPIG